MLLAEKWILVQVMIGFFCIVYHWLHGRSVGMENRSPIIWKTSAGNFFIFLWVAGTFILGLLPLPTIEGKYAAFVLTIFSQGVLLLLLGLMWRKNIFQYRQGLESPWPSWGVILRKSLCSYGRTRL
jgi:hypothetical protein